MMENRNHLVEHLIVGLVAAGLASLIDLDWSKVDIDWSKWGPIFAIILTQVLNFVNQKVAEKGKSCKTD